MFFTDNYGSSWSNISGSLPNVPVRCIAFKPGINDEIYIGTDIGVYYRNNPIGDWIYFSNLLPNTVVRDLEISGGNIYAGTWGRGVWQSPLHSGCPSNLTLTPVNDPSNPLSIGEQVYQASNSITTTRLINGNSAEIIYRSGNYIDMKQGFHAKELTFIEAKIGGCID